MNNLQSTFKTAQNYHRQHQLAMAEQLYRQITAAAPNFAEAAHLLGVLLSQQGAHQEGIVWIQKAINLQPTQAHYYHNLSKIYCSTRQWDTAIKMEQVALKLTPKFGAAWFNLGNAWKGKGNMVAALRAYQKAVAVQPDLAMAHYNIGNTYQEMGRMKSAMQAYQQCLTLESNNAQAHNNLGSMLEYWEDWEKAIDHYQKAINLQPNFQEAWTNLASCFEKQGKVAAARKCFDTLLKQQSNHSTNAWIEWHKNQLSEIIWANTKEIDIFRQILATQIAKFHQKPPALVMAALHKLAIQPPFDLAYQGKAELALKTKYAQFFDQFFKQIRQQIHNKQSRALRSQHRRIGFVVTQGHEGVFIKCMRGIINHLNSDLLQLTIVCNGPNGEAILRPAIKNQKVQFLSIAKRLDIAIKQVQQAAFDVLYYWEIGTDSLNYFLPFCQLAPIQCTSWGWPVTSGIPTLNYFLSCELLESENSQTHYSEQLVNFKKLPTYYYRPPVPKVLKDKAHFGLPNDKHLYLCVQNLRKIHPDMDILFSQILERDKDGLVVFIQDKQRTITEKLKQRLQQNCPIVFNRIHFIERLSEMDYLNLVAISEVILDTLHYTSGANTAYDAFAAGTPYITLPFTFHRSRYGAAAYQQLGLTELIAKNEEAYIAKAIKVATEPTYRTELSRRISANTPLIFEDVEAVKELEDFFINIQ